MAATVAVGLDLSLRATGMVALCGATSTWPKATGPQLIHSAVIETEELRGLVRIERVTDAVQGFLNWLKGRALGPDVVVIEGPAFSRQMAHSLGELHGVVKLDIARRRSRLVVVTAGPSVLKKFCSGAGNADKNVVMKRVATRWGFDNDDDNICDAYVAAMMGLCLYGELTPRSEQAQWQPKCEVIYAGTSTASSAAATIRAAVPRPMAGRVRRRRIA